MSAPDLRQVLAEAVAEAATHAGTLHANAWRDALLAMRDVYVEKLLTIEPENLVTQQQLIRQVDALLALTRGETTDPTV